MIQSMGLLLRLAGIDAPERDQPFGQRSRQSLAELAFKSVGDAVRTDGF
jgi:endonuclease YncB( thermonuclease family)